MIKRRHRGRPASDCSLRAADSIEAPNTEKSKHQRGKGTRTKISSELRRAPHLLDNCDQGGPTIRLHTGTGGRPRGTAVSDGVIRGGARKWSMVKCLDSIPSCFHGLDLCPGDCGGPSHGGSSAPAGDDSVDGGEIRYENETVYDDSLDWAVVKWNAVGSVDYKKDSATTNADLQVQDTYKSDVAWSGAYVRSSGPMRSTSTRTTTRASARHSDAR